MPVLIPDLLYDGGSFRRGLGLEIDAASGRIARVAGAQELERAARARGDVVETLPGPCAARPALSTPTRTRSSD